jgi:SAM-dependent methyltransferase
MRWLAKAAFQKGLSAFPHPERVNYLLQRHVTHKLPPGEDRLRRKFDRGLKHVEAYERHAAAQPFPSASLYEFGAGWDLAIPLTYWMLGAESQFLVDVRENLRLELVNVNLERFTRLAPELEEKHGRTLRIPGLEPLRSLEDLEERFGIRYRAPLDARQTGLGSNSVDFVSSTVTLEHVPREDIVSLLRECRRLLRPDGILSALIDLSDHFSQIDPSISRYNFLRYSDRTWSLFNSSLQHQNRMRRPDYLSAFDEAGLEVVSEEPETAGPKQLDALRGLELAERFRSYPFDELAVIRLRLVARAAGNASPHALVEAEDVGR